MFYIIKVLAKSLAALNSNAKPLSIAAAVAFAFWLALIPAGNLLWIMLLLISFILRVNWGIEILFLALFKGLALLLYPVIEPMGWNWLQTDMITNLVYTVNNIPVLAFLGLNNSLVIGGFVWGLISFVPLFILARLLLKVYREKLSPAVANSKWMKRFQKLPMVELLIKNLNQFSGLYR